MNLKQATYQEMYETYKAQADKYRAKLDDLKQQRRELRKIRGDSYNSSQGYETSEKLEASIDNCQDILADLNWSIECLKDRYGVIVKL